jgi:hypothetical protein
VLLGLSNLAGASGVIGSSAFTSASVERGVTVQVANDTDAFLRLAPCKGSPNGAYVTGANSGTMTLDLSLSNSNVLGDGVNVDATTVFDNVFEICNQGTQEVGVRLDVDPIDNGNGDPAVEFYQDGDQSSDIVGQSNAVCLDVGDCVCVGFVARTQGLDSSVDNLLDTVSGNSELIIHADADMGIASPDRDSTRTLAHAVGG